MTAISNRRVLIVDDNDSVHEDFRKILAGTAPEAQVLDALEDELFGTRPAPASERFELTSAHQGAEAVELVRRAVARGEPFALAFVDVRMPPGIDGIETLRRMWELDPELQAVICSAYSDYSWDQMVGVLGRSDRFVILRKPFENVEVIQLAHALAAKWELALRARARVEGLEDELRRALRTEAMGRLAAGIAHEINTPMQYVATSLAYIEEAIAAPGVAAHDLPAAVADARAGVARVVEIVRSMAAVFHRGPEALVPVDVNQALSAALTVCQSDYRQVAEVVRELGAVPPVLGNAGALAQTFVNLIVNATDAIRDTVAGTVRKGTLRVRSAVEERWVTVSIADDGPGIPDAVRDRVFEPFFTTKPVGRGTGQGLAIARAIVEERLGGVLAFETAAGQGTTFHVRLPRAAEGEAAA